MRYNTNGTVFPEHALDKLFPYFHDVQVHFSIDGIGERFEYMRNGAKWDLVLENLKKFKEIGSARMGICITVSNLNIFYLFETLDFFLAEKIPVYFNILHGPEYFQITCLPEAAKNEILKKFESTDIAKYRPILLNKLEAIFEFLKLRAPEKAVWSEFIKSVKLHDQYRGENYLKTFPAMENFFI